MRSRRKRTYIPRPIDQVSMAAGSAIPGGDPRQWCSFGTVSAEDDEPVVFDEDEGQPLVKVLLQPSMVAVFARVASQVAGNGEGEWHPFVKGDEVVVLVMEGNERAGCVIVGRLNNAIDKFPMESVAGQDPTTNAFAFRRRRTPFLEEMNGPVLMRSAKTGAFFSIDDAGVVTIKDAENAALQMTPDVFGYQGPSSTTSPPEFLLQMDLTGEHFLVQIKDAILSLSSSTATPEQNTLSVPGPMTIGTSGNPPLEHVTTTEASTNLLFQELLSLAAMITALGAPPLTGASLGAAITAWLAAGFPAAIATAKTAPLTPPVLAAILAAFATPGLKPNTPAGQAAPSIGCVGLFAG